MLKNSAFPTAVHTVHLVFGMACWFALCLLHTDVGKCKGLLFSITGSLTGPLRRILT